MIAAHLAFCPPFYVITIWTSGPSCDASQFRLHYKIREILKQPISIKGGQVIIFDLKGLKKVTLRYQKAFTSLRKVAINLQICDFQPIPALVRHTLYILAKG